MTPYKELYTTIKNTLLQIPQLEYVDLYRKSLDSLENEFPNYTSLCLIKVSNIKYETMTEQNKQGNVWVDVILYCKDSWLKKYNTSEDSNDDYIEIDLLDTISQKLQLLNSKQNSPLQQVEYKIVENSVSHGIAHCQTFVCAFQQKINPKTSNLKLTLK